MGMSSEDNQFNDDQLIIRYLLGRLPAEETERLDELSITDTGFVERWRAVENDLVDAYARGELSGDTLAHFESSYLASASRREKVSFAKALADFEASGAALLPEALLPESPDHSRPVRRSRWFGIFDPRSVLQWGFGAAALLLIVAGVFLIRETSRLRNQIVEAQLRRDTLQQREQELERELAEQNTVNDATTRELEQVREALSRAEKELANSQTRSGGSSSEPVVVALSLGPATRGINQLATVSVPPSADYLALKLEVESEFLIYQAVLKNPATNQVLWRSSTLRVTSYGSTKILSMSIKAALLKSQIYLLEVAGVHPDGATQLVSSYSFRVVNR
jgi:hypothetical protein